MHKNVGGGIRSGPVGDGGGGGGRGVGLVEEGVVW